jgi:glycerophosphoryl diester phosphodiesterase
MLMPCIDRFALLLFFSGWIMLISLAGCSTDRTPPGEGSVPSGLRRRLSDLAPAAVIGHRGTGKNRPGHPFPENSLSSFREAVRQGADGIELDLELTADGALVVMHDDTLDRTTNGSGCVSRKTLPEIRAFRLLDAAGRPGVEPPPTLDEVLAALPPQFLINVELKAFGPDCSTQTTRPSDLARAAVREVTRLGGTERCFFASFDEQAAVTVKQENPSLYSALLLDRDRSLAWESSLEQVKKLGLDAVHPHFLIPAEGIHAARLAELQVNVYTVNGRFWMNAMLDRGVTSLITDEPGLLRAVIEERRRNPHGL